MEFSLFASSMMAIGLIVLSVRYSLFKKQGMHTRHSYTKNPRSTMDIILIIVGVFLAIFTIAMICLFCLCGSVPDTLITCVFGACAGECGIMGWIKTNKVKHVERKWELEDRKEFKEKG